MCTCDMFVNEIWECLYGNEAIHKSSRWYRRCGSTRMHSFAGSATGPTSPHRLGPPPLPSLQVLPALTGRASLPCPLPRSYQPPQVGPLPCPLPGPTAIPVSPHRSDPTPSSSPGPTSPHRSGPTPLPSPWSYQPSQIGPHSLALSLGPTITLLSIFSQEQLDEQK